MPGRSLAEGVYSDKLWLALLAFTLALLWLLGKKPPGLRSPVLLVLPHILSHYRNWWMKLEASVVCQSRRREPQQLTGMKEI